MKILIVEDSVKIREIIKSVLKNSTTEFIECFDGAEALSAYDRHRPDWVLMDIKMKVTDGISATKEIKQHFPAAKILIVTNYDDPQLRDASRKVGACGYLLKDNLLKIKEIISS